MELSNSELCSPSSNHTPALKSAPHHVIEKDHVPKFSLDRLAERDQSFHADETIYSLSTDSAGKTSYKQSFTTRKVREMEASIPLPAQSARGTEA